MRLEPTHEHADVADASSRPPLIGIAVGARPVGAHGACAARCCRSRFIALTLAVAFFNDASFIGGVRPFDSGDDGLVYDGYARVDAAAARWPAISAGALRGEESVFYFTPGMRYLRAFEHVIFGESYLGYLALMLLLPMLVFAVFRRFLPLRWALALRWRSRRFRSACCSARASCSTSSGRRAASPIRPPMCVSSRGSCCWSARTAAGRARSLRAGLRRRAAVRARAVRAAEPRAGRRHPARRRRTCGAVAGAVSTVAGMCIGFLPVFGMALHNWVYGGVLVLFTDHQRTGRAVDAAAAYVAALRRTAAARFRRRACDAGAAADRRLARRPVRMRWSWRRCISRRSPCWCAWRCGGGPIRGCG